MFAIIRPLLIALLLIVGLSYALGIIKYEKPAYGCYHGRKLGFGDKTKVFQLGNINFYTYPLLADCPKDDRYDPDNIYSCGLDEFCQKN
jgi:hypothetical protein